MLAFALALGAGFTSVAPVFAADPTGGISVTSATQGSYNAYLLFEPDYIIPNETARTALITVIQSQDSSFKLDPTQSKNAQDAVIAQELTDLINGDKTFANKVAKAIQDANVPATATTTVAAGADTADFTNLNPGYYLVTSDASNPVVTSAIMLSVESTTATAVLKGSEPATQKSVETTKGTESVAGSTDTGVSTEANGTLKANNVSTYTINGTWNQNIPNFATYMYAIVDTLPKGVDVTEAEIAANGSWNVSIKAYKSNTDATPTDVMKDFTPTISAATADAGSTITWSCPDLKAALTKAGWTDTDLAGAQAHISVEYTPVYDQTDLANLYKTDWNSTQTNSAYVSYTKNPQTLAEGSAEAAPSATNLYSYQLTLTKKDGSGNPLPGAVFTLTNADGVDQGVEVTTDDNGKFVWNGLESGTYTLTETSGPAGYKMIDPITFTIGATFGADGTLTQVTPTITSDGSKVAAFAATAAGSPLLSVDVTNVKGAQLPVTGQQGIIIGTIAGTIVVAAAVAGIGMSRKHRD